MTDCMQTPGLEQVGSKSMTLDTRVADWLGHSGALIKSGRSGGNHHSFSQQRSRCIYYSSLCSGVPQAVCSLKDWTGLSHISTTYTESQLDL